jgi:hypothetical protein
MVEDSQQTPRRGAAPNQAHATNATASAHATTPTIAFLIVRPLIPFGNPASYESAAHSKERIVNNPDSANKEKRLSAAIPQKL